MQYSTYTTRIAFRYLEEHASVVRTRTTNRLFLSLAPGGKVDCSAIIILSVDIQLSTVMPTDGCFGFSVLVAGLPVPEYTKDGEIYVESNLWTPASYQMSIKEFAYGEMEEQKWPVTPYTIKVYTKPCCPLSWFDVYVDGVKVGWEVCGGAMRKEW